MNNIMQDLPSVLDQIEAEGLTETSEAVLAGYRIGGKSEAAWALEHLRSYLQRKAENDQVAADRIQSIRAWQEAENAKLVRSIDFFTGALKTWHMDEYTKDEKHNKTISLPDGVLKRTAGRLSIVVQEEETFLGWAKENHPEWIRTKEEPAKDEIKNNVQVKDGDLYDDNGVLVPGAIAEFGDDSFKVVPLGGES